MSFPLTAAERFVDFPAHALHIQVQRRRVEVGAQRAVRSLAFAIADPSTLHTQPAQLALASAIGLRLGATASFGFQQARKELAAQRRKLSERDSDVPRLATGTDEASPARPVSRSENILARYVIPDAGVYARVAQAGLDSVRNHARERARRAAAAIAYATSAAAALAEDRDKVLVLAAATQAALKTLHNHVLELVGETLNMGRSAGALSLKNPPEFALRSEALDKATCDQCTREHGEIYQVGSSDYFSHMPPTFCYGGGRCRGLMVFSYGPEDVRAPEPTEEELSLLRKAA